VNEKTYRKKEEKEERSKILQRSVQSMMENRGGEG
jgi:hypothetical protein